MRTTLKMIADEAGVSVGAVSQVLRKGGRMAPEKRQRVLAIADRYRYRPNLLVQSLQSGRTRMIGVMIPILSEFQAKLLSGIHDELVEADHVPITVWGDPGVPDGNAYELAQLHRLVDRRVDGILLTSALDLSINEMDREIRDRKIPFVVLDSLHPHLPSDVVQVDNVAGGQLAARHLLELGHRRFGLLRAEFHSSSTTDRENGFREAVTSAGADCVMAEMPSHHTDELGPALKMLRPADRPTAIFCSNDFLAVRIYQAAGQLGLRIPQDISVIGFANLDFTRFMIPQLTTVDQFTYRMGREGARLLLKRLADGRTDAPWNNVALTPELVCRASTAAPQVG